MTLEVGDLVQIDQIPDGLDVETSQAFALCLRRSFPVVGFDLGLVELEVGEVFGEAAYMRSIWIEPQFVSKCADQG